MVRVLGDGGATILVVLQTHAVVHPVMHTHPE